MKKHFALYNSHFSKAYNLMKQVLKYTIKMGENVPGVTFNRGWQFCTYAECGHALFLCIYDSSFKEKIRINLNDYNLGGCVYSVCLEDIDLEGYYYRYEADGVPYLDEYVRELYPVRAYGEALPPDTNNYGRISKPPVRTCDYPHIPNENVISYFLHVRGYTMDSSSRVKNPGTFDGIAEKIDYIKNLGVNQLILMPVYEFNEIDKKSGKINFWGFTESKYFAVKSSYGCGNATSEFYHLIRELHKNGIEVIMQVFFPKDTKSFFTGNVLRFWHDSFGVDGFYLLGEGVDVNYLCAEPSLTEARLYFEQTGVPDLTVECMNHNVSMFSSEYMNTVRKFLKSDAGIMQAFTYSMRSQRREHGILNYISNFNELCLRDMVTYDFKHNDDNGEFNRDGNNDNYSWNCGVEGETKSIAINRLRFKQMKNAMTMLLMATGIPMILSGDEWAVSRGGNNNPYCQDNEISYLNWKCTKNGERLREHVKALIKIRRENKIIHPNMPYRLMDYKAISYPDLSYHSEDAWYPEFMDNSRAIGMLYCKAYEENENETGVRDADTTAFVYIAYNMHWDEKKLALPNLPKGKSWKCVLNTDIIGQDANSPCDASSYNKKCGDKKNRKMEDKNSRNDYAILNGRSIKIYIAE